MDRYYVLVPFLLAISIYGLGVFLENSYPELGTNGSQLLIWGFFLSTIVLFHATWTINSLSHIFGKKRYAISDESKNNFWLSLLTFGEGWHNNHHRYPGTARQGVFWWEIDITYYLLNVLSWIRVIRDIRPLPDDIKNSKLLVKS
jgi:stearoyl-CoA desaturase (delta-9 desaturase)